MNSQKERFTLLLLQGMSPLDAYCDVYPLADDETRETRAVYQRATYLHRTSEIQQRLAELRAPVLKQTQKQLAFTIEQAHKKIDDVYQYAELLAEPSVMLKAIELQAKLHKLLGVERGEVRRDVLDEQTTDDLVMLLHELKARRQADVVIEASVVGEGVQPVGGSVDCSALL